MSPAAKKTWGGILKISAVVMVVSLGIWGCARKPVDRTAGNDRIRSLEGKCVKLEQNYRTVAEARDRARAEASRLQREVTDIEALTKERDELRQQAKEAIAQRDQAAKNLAKRTEERDQIRRDLNVKKAQFDTVSIRYERLRKSLQTIVTQDDTCPQGVEVPTTTPSLGIE